MDIGIDLGTTFSVVAVKGQVETAPGYPPGLYLKDEGMDVTILPDLAGNHTFPSVFWWEPDPTCPEDHTKGTYTFGWEAKQLAEEGKSPIMFSKRSIGTNQKLVVNGREFTAKEVATHFLRHMRDVAEKVTGQEVQRAVVTHPAYFDPGQKAETLQAALDAGLNITPEQMMMEPCAAALAFTINDPRGVQPGDPLRVLTYDLGGGTFDVAVMEKIEGVIVMKKFDGNHLLGGYDFDKALVQWVLNHLKAQGRDIPFDESNPEHLGRRARMLQVAEAVKIKLSEQKTPKVKVPVKVDFLVDAKGQRVQFTGSINREEYAALIRDELEETLTCCRRALAALNLKPSDLQAVLLVGGSTFGPWVQELVNKEFGVNVEPFAPDYCVAAGAALMVARLTPLSPKNERVVLALDYQAASVLPTTNIGGSIQPAPQSPLTPDDCRRLQILLVAPDGRTLGPADIDAEGKFLFPKVALLEDEPSQFTVTVNEAGTELLAHHGSITYSPDTPPVPQPVPTLPRPLYLKADHMIALAEEGVPLPAKCQVRLTKAFNDPVITIPIFMENEQVGTITIDDIPEEAGEGCAVIVEVEATQENDLRGRVQVLGPAGTPVKEGPVLITFPPVQVPDLPQLRGKAEELRDRLDQEIEHAPAQDRARLAGPGRKLVKQIEKLFAEQQPDRQKLHEKVKELERLVFPPPDDMDPPRKEFEALVGECREILAASPENPGLKAFEPQLTRVEGAGKEAATTKNHKRWAAANDTLRQLAARIQKIQDGGDSKADSSRPKTPPTPMLKVYAGKQVQALRAALNAAREARERQPGSEHWLPICEDVARKIARLESDVNKISDETPNEQALAQIQSYLAAAPALQSKIHLIHEGVKVTK